MCLRTRLGLEAFHKVQHLVVSHMITMHGDRPHTTLRSEDVLRIQIAPAVCKRCQERCALKAPQMLKLTVPPIALKLAAPLMRGASTGRGSKLQQQGFS
jgi:hypothetical protein